MSLVPTFDVVIPCYNYARYLERSVGSALAQKGADVRVLIIDDCSSDDTPEVGRRLAALDPRIEFRRHEKNKKFIPTANEGILGWAKSEFTLLLSADDTLLPGAFRQAYEVFKAHPDVGLVYGLARVVRDGYDALPVGSASPVTKLVVPGTQFLEYCCRSGFNPVPSPAAMVRTDWQHRLGGYREDMPHTSDLEMWMRFAANGSVGVVCEALAEYRVHESNMTRLHVTEAVGDRPAFAYTCRQAIEPLLKARPEAAAWLEEMHTTMLRDAYRNAADAYGNGDRSRSNAWVKFASEVSPHTANAVQIVERLKSHLRFSRLAFRRLSAPKVQQSPSAEVEWGMPHGAIFGAWPKRPGER